MSSGNTKTQEMSTKDNKAQATSSEDNKGDPSKQYRMLLNTITMGQGGYATFDFQTEETGLSNKPTWAATVTGTGSTKSEANDKACKKMLDIFAEYGVLPKLTPQAPNSG
ncbi:hypothetical protein FRC00_008516 [Tulasnella sp. 408]|nr:hypothetical protein FRC00_008516 [Tulasnella sp. 408]